MSEYGSTYGNHREAVNQLTEMAEPPPKKARGVTAAATDADAHEVVQQLVEVKETVSAGRGLFTTRAVAAGTTLAAEVPVLRWVDVSMQDSVCGWCLCHFAAGLSDICKGCSRIRWCSVACRTAHAVEHGAACAVLAPLGSKSVRPEVDALLGLAPRFSSHPYRRGGRATTNFVPHVCALVVSVLCRLCCCRIEQHCRRDVRVDTHWQGGRRICD